MKICEIEIYSSWRFHPDEKEPSLSFNFEDEAEYDAVSDGSGENFLKKHTRENRHLTDNSCLWTVNILGTIDIMREMHW